MSPGRPIDPGLLLDVPRALEDEPLTGGRERIDPPDYNVACTLWRGGLRGVFLPGARTRRSPVSGVGDSWGDWLGFGNGDHEGGEHGDYHDRR